MNMRTSPSAPSVIPPTLYLIWQNHCQELVDRFVPAGQEIAEEMDCGDSLISAPQIPALATDLAQLYSGILHPTREAVLADRSLCEQLPRTVVCMNRARRIRPGANKSKILGHFTLNDEAFCSGPPSALTKRQLEIVSALQTSGHGDWTIKKLSVETGCHVSKLTNSIRCLIRIGIVSHHGV